MTSGVGKVFLKTLKLAQVMLFLRLWIPNYATDCHEIFRDVLCIAVLRYDLK